MSCSLMMEERGREDDDVKSRELMLYFSFNKKS